VPAIRAAILAISMIPVFLTGASGQPDTEEEILARLCRAAARETLAAISHGSVELKVLPESTPPPVKQVFAEELASRGASPSTGRAELLLTIDVRAMNSSTVQFDNSSYLRTVSITLGTLAEERKSGGIVWSKEFRFSEADTLSGKAPYTFKDLREAEGPSLLESLFMPVAAAAAAIVIVVLLFTVRGS
jgi:hypothetical protein